MQAMQLSIVRIPIPTNTIHPQELVLNEHM